jgi:ABC-2 type transport system permease protein
MFFASTALNPLWRIQEASPLLYRICAANPFSHAVELIRFALFAQLKLDSCIVVIGCLAVFLALAIYGYDPSRGVIARRGGPGGPPG